MSATTKQTYINREDQLYNKRTYWRIKRTQDVVLSFFALVFFAFPMLIIAVIILIDDPGGSPFFSQTRCGRDGKEFKFWKFRTMCVDAEAKLEELLKDNEMDGPAFKLTNDPRVTRFGRILRKTSLDELPQLWNILKGDMSIVGPRPCLPRELEQYNTYQMQRVYVTPGLTCYWQIQPNRNEMSFDDWVELDVKYIQERSFLVDWIIIFKTVGAVLEMDGI